MTDRFARTAARIALLQDARAEALAERVRSFVPATGTERALDVGAGAGALAFALAPLVREVVAVDLEPALLDEGRRRAPETSRSSRPTRRRCRSTTSPSTSPARSARCITSSGRSSSSRSSPASRGRAGSSSSSTSWRRTTPPPPSELNRFEQARDASTSRVLARCGAARTVRRRRPLDPQTPTTNVRSASSSRTSTLPVARATSGSAHALSRRARTWPSSAGTCSTGASACGRVSEAGRRASARWAGAARRAGTTAAR